MWSGSHGKQVLEAKKVGRAFPGGKRRELPTFTVERKSTQSVLKKRQLVPIFQCQEPEKVNPNWHNFRNTYSSTCNIGGAAMKMKYRFAELSKDEKEMLEMVLLEEMEMQTWYAITACETLGEVFVVLQ